jgi:hypothetical protein
VAEKQTLLELVPGSNKVQKRKEKKQHKEWKKTPPNRDLAHVGMMSLENVSRTVPMNGGSWSYLGDDSRNSGN